MWQGRSLGALTPPLAGARLHLLHLTPSGTLEPAHSHANPFSHWKPGRRRQFIAGKQPEHWETKGGCVLRQVAWLKVCRCQDRGDQSWARDRGAASSPCPGQNLQARLLLSRTLPYPSPNSHPEIFAQKSFRGAGLGTEGWARRSCVALTSSAAACWSLQLTTAYRRQSSAFQRFRYPVVRHSVTKSEVS